jgi:hypothetical protein
VLGYKTYVQIPKEHCVINQKVTRHAKVRILVDYKSSHIFKVYILLRKGPVESRIIRSLNVRFNKRGLITKPFLEKDKKADI